MKKEKKQKKYIYIIIMAFVILSMLLSGYFLYKNILENDIETVREYMKDEEDYIDTDKISEDKVNDENEIEKESTLAKSERIDKVKKLQEQNSDIVGWLEIPDTIISYPVLQAEDNSYYMRRNYKKKITQDGSLFLDKDYSFEKPSTNLLIYGHNNRNSKEMFVKLMDYRKETFYNEHPTIRFTTEKEDAVYDIISVFYSRVYYKRETDVFRYYYFIDAENEEEFNKYVEECKKASIYDIDATAEYGDKLITLSTCEYSQKDGRFVVVARKRN